MQGKPEKTTALCSELIENDIPNADIYRLLGHAHLMSEHYISAENAFRQCLLLRPEDNEAMLGLAKCLLQEERYKECHSLMEELLSENPENPELWSLRANTAIALDDQEQALVSIESARRLNAATADMLATLGDIYINRQQIREALTAYEKSFSGQPPSFNRIIRAARGLLSIGSSSEATKMLERANSLSENSFTPSQTVKILKLRAAIANQDGDTNRAVKIYRQALKQAPLNGDILLALADIERGRGDIETSKMNAERAARLPGFEARAFVMLAQLEVERENYTAAADLLEKSLSFKDQKHIRQYLGRVRRLTDR
jgi:tetratricopeptide (TPR) repeat protein